MDPRPVPLVGRRVRLEPLSAAHAPDLFALLAADPSLWRWWRVPPPASLPEMEALVAADLAAQERGALVVFAQVEPGTGRPVGATSYLNISRPDRGLEIGSTWLARAWQRTGVNTEAKYLLLRHAFEDLGAVRVQLKTDLRNLQSQAAIERLGAVREGVLRKHLLVRDGHIRDTVMYSVVEAEWPTVKSRLEGLMARSLGPARDPPGP
jgi:RimJ/RimL family protein N-acetyltransferase